MNWNIWIRQIHRWVSIAFTVTVIANFIALAQGSGMPPPWVTYRRCSRSFSCSPVCICSRCRMPPSGAEGGQHEKVRASQDQSASGSSRNESPNSGTGAVQPSAECARSSSKPTRTLSRSEVGQTNQTRHPGLVARWHHLHWRILQECREADLRQGRGTEGSSRLFNSSLDGNVPRDRHPQEEDVDASAFKTLVRQAVALNSAGKTKPSKKAK